jgi:small subunit ribosomal protein S11
MSEEKKQPEGKKKDAEAKAGGKAAAKPADRPVKKKKVIRNVVFARAYVQCSFNNTIVSITDDHGGVISWASAGSVGFKGTKKGTPFAAAKVGELVGDKAAIIGIKEVDCVIRGVGAGRESALRGFSSKGIEITKISDDTPVPHNGPRPPRARRI